MSKEYIRKYIEQKEICRVPGPMPRMWDIRNDVSLSPHGNDHIRYEMSVKVSTRVEGPSEAAKDIVEQSIRALTHEMYGHIYKELWDLRTLLYEETYRSEDSPVLAQLTKIQEMVRP